MPTYNRKDRLYNQAKEEGYRSRAAYKLLELDDKFHFFKKSAKVIDLGCAPGSWLQVVATKVGKNGVVIGIDRLPVVPFANNHSVDACQPVVLQGDILDPQTQAKIIEVSGGKVDVVLSDMSPDLSGVYFRDASNSAELVQMAFNMACNVLKVGGAIVTKIFPGQEADEIFKSMQPYYTKLTRETLKSTRTTSKEIYFVGTGFKGKR